MTKISGHIFNCEGLGRRYLSDNPYYQQLYREKKARNAADSGVKILFSWKYLFVINMHQTRHVRSLCAKHVSFQKCYKLNAQSICNIL